MLLPMLRLPSHAAQATLSALPPLPWHSLSFAQPSTRHIDKAFKTEGFSWVKAFKTEGCSCISTLRLWTGSDLDSIEGSSHSLFACLAQRYTTTYSTTLSVTRVKVSFGQHSSFGLCSRRFPKKKKATIGRSCCILVFLKQPQCLAE